MTEPILQTPIDRAHAAMEDGGHSDRAQFFDRVAEAELFLWLEAEPEGERVNPRIFPVEGAAHVLAFDTEDRLSDFAEQQAPYVALSGRVLAGMLAGQGIGLGLNLGAPSAILLPPDAMDWLAGALGEGPDEREAVVAWYEAPRDVPKELLRSLDAKLAAAAGLAEVAWLASVGYEDGGRGHMLAFGGAVPGAEAALARAMGEALTFSGLEAGALDVAFLPPGDGRLERIAKVGVRIDIPRRAARATPRAPGSDPAKPPRLR